MRWSAVLALSVLPFCSISAVAETVALDATYCGKAIQTAVGSNEGLGAYHHSFTGVVMGKDSGDSLRGTTLSCDIVHYSDVDTKAPVKTFGYCVSTDREGDAVVWEAERMNGILHYKALRGTGKWSGSSGEGTATPIVVTKTKDGYHICSQFKGKLIKP